MSVTYLSIIERPKYEQLTAMTLDFYFFLQPKQIVNHN